MKRPIYFASAICLALGLLAGGVLPMPWDRPDAIPISGDVIIQPPASSSAQDTAGSTPMTAPEPLNSKSNLSLLSAAYSVAQFIKTEDYTSLAAYVHPDRGVTFTPYSTVAFETDLTLTRDQIKNLATDTKVYTWGIVDGRGSLIELTISDYFAQYVFDADYTQAPQIGIDQIMMGGNALENLPEAYPDCRFVDFTFPSADASVDGLDWSSLKLVFAPGDTCWQLVGVVHGQWTI